METFTRRPPRHFSILSCFVMALLCSVVTDGLGQAAVQFVYVQKTSDAIEGGKLGQYKIGLHYPVPIAQDVVVGLAFTGAGQAIPGVDFGIVGFTGFATIPAGATQVVIDVNAPNDGIIEGPENIVMELTGAVAGGTNIAIDPANTSARMKIADANAASSTPIQVLTGSNASEPAKTASFMIKLAGVATSAWPVHICYELSGTASPGTDYQLVGETIIPANANLVNVTINPIDDHIIEVTENIHIRLLGGSTTDGGGNAFMFPPDPANNDIDVSLFDDDYTPTNATISLTKIKDAAEPASPGTIRMSLPGDYVASSNVLANIQLDGSAINGTDYTISQAMLRAYLTFSDLNLNVVDDTLTEGTESVVYTLTGASDENALQYTGDMAQNVVTVDITDDESSLPLRLVSFEGSIKDNRAVLLNWVTAEEENTSHFRILRSGDGRKFEQIGVITASGSGDHHYIFTDSGPGPLNFYRLHMIDLDGSSSYSRMISIRSNELSPVTVFPSPVKNQLTVDLGNQKLSPHAARIIDSSGNVHKEVRLTGGLQTISVDNLLPGLYFLSVEGGQTIKFLVAQ